MESKCLPSHGGESVLYSGFNHADAWCSNMGGKEKALNAGATALQAGIRHIDSAQVYGTEAEVNGAIQKAGLNRDEVFTTTKREILRGLR